MNQPLSLGIDAPSGDGAARARTVRSFVRREGRITAAQTDALERLWPRYGVDPAAAPLDSMRLFGRSQPLCVEIGFGNGDHLAAYAAAHPDRGFLGIEVHRPGVGRLLQQAEQLQLDNLKVACADAVEVVRNALPEASVDEFDIFFPDPWPKKRHHKRRLVQPQFVALLGRCLGSGGRLRLATDWPDYASHMLQVMSTAEGFINAAGDGYAPRPPGRATTRFEARGLRLGHPVFDLDFRKA